MRPSDPATAYDGHAALITGHVARLSRPGKAGDDDARSACHAVAAVALASGGDVTAATWGEASSLALRLPPADPSRLLLVRQALESAPAHVILAGPVRRAVSESAGEVAKEALLSSRIDPESAAVLARFATVAGTKDAVREAAVVVSAMLRANDAPLAAWERAAVVESISTLAMGHPRAAARAICWAASTTPPDSGSEALGPLLAQVQASCRLVCASVSAPGYTSHPDTFADIVAAATSLFVNQTNHPEALGASCRLLMILQRADRGEVAAAFAGCPCPHLVRRRARGVVRAAASDGGAYRATCALFFLQHVNVFCGGVAAYACRNERSCRGEAELLSAALRIAASIDAGDSEKAGGFGGGGCLTRACCSAVRTLVERSPLFASEGGGLRSPLWVALADPRSCEDAAAALFYLYAVGEEDEGAKQAVMSALRQSPDTRVRAVSLVLAARLSSCWGDARLSGDSVEAFLSRPAGREGGRLDSSLGARIIRLVPGGNPQAAAVVSAVVAATDPDSPAVGKLFVQAAVWTGPMSPAARRALTDLACKYLAAQRGGGTRDTRAALLCVVEPRPANRRDLEALIGMGDPETFPALVRSYAATFRQEVPGKNLRRRAMEKIRAALKSVQEARGLDVDRGGECSDAAWWAETAISVALKKRVKFRSS